MMGMGADVDQDHRSADARWVKPPPGGHVLRSKISLDVLKVKLADRANRPCLDHGSGLAHHWIAGVTMCEAEFGSCRLDLASKAYSRGEVCSQRLIADQMKSGSHRQ